MYKMSNISDKEEPWITKEDFLKDLERVRSECKYSSDLMMLNALLMIIQNMYESLNENELDFYYSELARIDQDNFFKAINDIDQP